MQVTAAHEYFHAVQFAYDYYEDGWLMEATATWAEDELYDSVNDNVNYLADGQMGTEPGGLRGSQHALDGFWDGNFYGNWIFFRYLTERMTASKAGMPVLVRDIWRLGPATADYSLRAVSTELAERGRDFGDTYASFAEANRRSRTTYDEGQSQRYPTSQTWLTQTLTAGQHARGRKSRPPRPPDQRHRPALPRQRPGRREARDHGEHGQPRRRGPALRSSPP